VARPTLGAEEQQVQTIEANEGVEGEPLLQMTSIFAPGAIDGFSETKNDVPSRSGLMPKKTLPEKDVASS
jgi:hypothetical protein